MHHLPARTDVVVVGAGPTGLTLAAGLARLGVDHVVIDRRDDVAPGSKAAGVQPRTLEHLDRLGAAAGLVDAGIRGTGFRLAGSGRTLLHAGYGELDTAFPFLLLIPQQTVEEHLQATALAAGSPIHRGHRLLDVRRDHPGVTATVATPDGTVRALSARYLVGADGVHSAVREQAGIPFPGTAPEALYALADVRTDPIPSTVDTTFHLSDKGLLLTSPLPGDVLRVVASAAPGSAAPTAADVETLLRERGGLTHRVREVVTASTYRVQERVAARLSDGPVFLAGDAAHTHSPAGAQGMNTGIQDAGNLAWKLHAVLSGRADAALLATYHEERHPVAESLIDFTGLLARLTTVPGPAAARLRDTVVEAAAGAPGVTAWLAARLAQLDIGDRFPTTTAAPDGLNWLLVTPDAVTAPPGPLTVRTVPGAETTTLVRPDGLVAARGVPADPAAVTARLGEWAVTGR